MPWHETHKPATRARIVKAAAAALRARGIAGVSVAELMAQAGLTHGGFYAHFRSKQELFSAAIEQASRETVEGLSRAFEGLPADRRLGAVIDTYLSSGHAEHPELGCPLAALGSELSRLGGQVQRDLGDSAKQRIAWVRGLVPDRGDGDASAIGAIACMVGGLLLARAVDRQSSPAVLEAPRTFLRRALQDEPPAVEVEPVRASGKRGRVPRAARPPSPVTR
jgi:TetR/AcrR family transcriptional repressor of nem operon